MNSTAGHANEGGRRTVVADLVVRGPRIYSLGAEGAVHRALAVRGERIAAVADGAHGLDELIGPNTRVFEEPGWTVLPGFTDTHTHLIFASSRTSRSSGRRRSPSCWA